ncbi:hypothetical protein CHS0354_024037 [Potamilus streckersoni]|uniref:MIP18 family-like domain-containing protein n=1 Tax=Potamilus streckersoni TaxID=2493646 RepID=A0AAE0S046_9BIVA|nr:hypothetical protein CHS0354_024037 [Potamilus streckersoni]
MKRITEKQVLDALSNVIEPDLGKDLVTLNMIQNVVITDEGKVEFTVVLTTPACPLKEMIHQACTNAIKHFIKECTEVYITMSANVTSQKAQVSTGGEGQFIKNTIAVASGKGGVGKSTVAVNIAVSLVQAGAKVGLIDADVYGPSIPTMFGLTGEKPRVEGGKLFPIEKYGIKLMSIGFLTDPQTAVIWRGPMLAAAIKQFVNDVLWGPLDYLIFDLPPGTGDVQLSLSQSLSLTGAVIVTTPQSVALADVVRAISMFNTLKVPIIGLIENMSYFELPDGTKEHLFGEGGGEKLANERSISLLGKIPITKALRERGDAGNPISLDKETKESSLFRAISSQIARQIAIKNANLPSNGVKIEL